jgi:hypothetical protein
MGRIVQPASVPGGSGVPDVSSMFFTTGQTFKNGAILIPDAATGRVIEGASAAVTVIGVALEDAGSKPGLSLNFDSLVLARTGNVQEVSVAKANRTTVFSSRMINGGTDPVTPVQADQNKKYGLIRTAAGEWAINQADVTTVAALITDIDIDNKIVFWKFLEAVLVLTA